MTSIWWKVAALALCAVGIVVVAAVDYTVVLAAATLVVPLLGRMYHSPRFIHDQEVNP